MNRLRIVMLLFTLWLGTSESHATTAPGFNLSTFQAPDGAITVTEGGMVVEPYFALKALLVAKDAGIDVTLPAQRFMAWMSADARGSDITAWPRFHRSCRADPGANWAPCGNADADDALLALWLEVLAEVPAAAKLSVSAQQGDHALAVLYSKDQHVYQINAETPVALLMDNAEIASSFAVRARVARLHHEPQSARHLVTQYRQLVNALPEVFPSADGLPAASTQTGRVAAFYPDQVLPMFLQEENIPLRRFSPALLSYDEWMQRYREPWLHGDADAYPWGLVALVSDRHKDEPTVACWLQRAETLRHGAHWNILEESVWQALLIHRSFPREAMTC